MQTHIQIKPSTWLAWYCALLHLATIALMIWLPLPWFARVIALITIIASLVWHWWVQVTRAASHAIVGLSHVVGESWRIQTRCGEQIAVKLCADSVVTTKVALLHLKPLTKRYRWHSLIVAGDALPADEFRRFCVYVRTKGLRQAAS